MVEIIPKPEKKILAWQDALFYFSLILATGIVLSYFFLINQVSRSSNTLQDLEGEISKVGTFEDKVLEAEVFSYEKKIKHFSELFNRRQKSLNFFQFLEKISHPMIWFSKLTLDLEKSQASLSGQAPSFETVGQQLLIFQTQDLIQEVNLSNLSLGKKGEIEFDFYLSLNPEIFK